MKEGEVSAVVRDLALDILEVVIVRVSAVACILLLVLVIVEEEIDDNCLEGIEVALVLVTVFVVAFAVVSVMVEDVNKLEDVIRGVDVVHTPHAAGQTCSVPELLHISATPRDSSKNRQKIGSLTPLQSGSVVVVEDAVNVVEGVSVVVLSVMDDCVFDVDDLVAVIDVELNVVVVKVAVVTVSVSVWVSVVGVDVVHTPHAAGQTCSVTELLHISATPRDSSTNRQK
jgi:hypothetical protein